MGKSVPQWLDDHLGNHKNHVLTMAHMEVSENTTPIAGWILMENPSLWKHMETIYQTRVDITNINGPLDFLGDIGIESEFKLIHIQRMWSVDS